MTATTIASLVWLGVSSGLRAHRRTSGSVRRGLVPTIGRAAFTVAERRQWLGRGHRLRARRRGGDLIFQLEDINDEFANTDVALVIGANDVVNPAARTDKSSPIFGMPILNADKAKQVYVVKRGEGKG